MIGVLGLWLHELAHALAARLVGFYVYEVRIGTGRLLKKFVFRDFELYLYAKPFGGWCLALPSSLAHQKWKNFFMVAAGPAADALVLIAIWQFTVPIAESLGYDTDWAEKVRVIYLVCFGYWTFITWLPNRIKMYGISCETDSLALWRLLHEKPATNSFPDVVFPKIYIRCLNLLYQNRKMAAARYYLKAKKESRLPTDPQSMEYTAALFDHTGLWKQAHKIRSTILVKTPLDSSQYTSVADSLACISLYQNRKELLPEAKGLIESVLKKYPDEITLKGTLGSILAELHQDDEAEKLLQEVLCKSSSNTDLSICSAYLAWMYAGKNRIAEARQFLETALGHEPLDGLATRKVSETKSLLGEPSSGELPLEGINSAPLREPVKSHFMPTLLGVLVLMSIAIDFTAIHQSWEGKNHGGLAVALFILAQIIAVPVLLLLRKGERWPLILVMALTAGFILWARLIE